MSRATHDIECKDCGYKGKVVDDSLVCPVCKESVEGQAITGEALEVMFETFRLRKLARESAQTELQPIAKEIRG